MSLVTANWKPTVRQLRQFGVLCAMALPCLAWLWSLGGVWIGGLAIVGIAIAVLAWLVPAAIAPLFIGLMLITLPIGLVLSELVLMLVYGLLFVPMGITFRCIGRDRLHREVDRERDSYWEDKSQPRSMASYYRQS